MKRTRMMVFGAVFAVLAGAGVFILTVEPAYACSGGGGGIWFWEWLWRY